MLVREFKTREEAELVSKSLGDILTKFHVVTVEDLNDLCGLPSTYEDNRWGWTYIDAVEIKQSRGGYAVVLPDQVRLQEQLQMQTQKRVSTVERNASKGRKLTSVNLPTEMITYLDVMAKDSGMSRSRVVEMILTDFLSSNRSITVSITIP